MSEFICEKCGKSFQNQDDLVRHKRYEEGKEEGRKTNEESRTNTQTGDIAPSLTGKIYTGESTANEALNNEMAARMANLLEGLDFPITKEQIINHLQNKAGDTNQNMDDILKFVQSRLQNNLKYNNVYEIEKTMNLVKER
jgi:hypothetical protein